MSSGASSDVPDDLMHVDVSAFKCLVDGPMFLFDMPPMVTHLPAYSNEPQSLLHNPNMNPLTVDTTVY